MPALPTDEMQAKRTSMQGYIVMNARVLISDTSLLSHIILLCSTTCSNNVISRPEVCATSKEWGLIQPHGN